MLNILIGTLIIIIVAFIHVYATLNEGSSFEKLMHYAMVEYQISYVAVFIALTTIALFLILIGLRGM